MLGLAFVEPSTNCPNRKGDETAANNPRRSARPRPVPGPGPGERGENRQRRMRQPPRPQCASSSCPGAAHRRVRSMLGPSLFGPTLDSRDVPGTSPGHSVIPPRPFNPFNRTHQRARLSPHSISPQEPLGVPAAKRPDCRTALVCIHLHRPKLSLAVVVNRHALPTQARRCEICLRRGQTTPWSSHPPAPLSRVRVCIPVWLKMDALTRLTSHHTLSRDLLRTWVPWVPSGAASCGYRLLTSECLAGFSSAQPEAEAEAKAESRILLLLLLLRLAAGPVRGRTVNMGPVKGSP